jgi:hypothetical protein
MSIEILNEAIIIAATERAVWKSETIDLFFIVFIHFGFNNLNFLYVEHLIP